MAPRKSVPPQPAQSTSAVNLQTVIESLQAQLSAAKARYASALKDRAEARNLCRDALNKMVGMKHQKDVMGAEFAKTAMACDKLITKLTEVDKTEKETRARAKRLQ